MSKFWQLENFGIESENGPVYDRFEETIVFDGTRYQVSLPFKEGHALLSDNFTLSKQRLMSLVKRLKTQPQVLAEYNEILEEQERLGIIETVPVTEIAAEVGEVHYLPHRAVIRKDKQTTWLRIVYDASARSNNGPSLNQILHAGPSLLPLINEIMLRFRTKQVALVGDLEKAF